ncbi:SH3 domain-containing protein [Mycena sp. CBHHK59/15]|nr:SH3 domain-containing protein [Mycena sp. CBHHK59/15]
MDSALLAHILSQTRQNVELLISQRQISAADGQDILAKLPNTPDRSMNALEQQTRNLLITPPFSGAAPPSPAYSHPPISQRSQLVRAKALWGYNEVGQDANDLSFRAGDMIEIVAETNTDWWVLWTGRHNGREGLFPSNYVEKLPSAAPSPYQSRDAYSNNSSAPSFPSQPAYPAPSGPPPVAYSAPAPNPPKKNKFGGLGNTLAQSAVGGVGFGAGRYICFQPL